jgi:deoxyxylulose-5-phosphate synthase
MATTPAKPKLELKMGMATREAYGIALVELGKKNPNVVALDADLMKSTFSAKFGKEFPDRFWTVGIAEAWARHTRTRTRSLLGRTAAFRSERTAPARCRSKTSP